MSNLEGKYWGLGIYQTPGTFADTGWVSKYWKDELDEKTHKLQGKYYLHWNKKRVPRLKKEVDTGLYVLLDYDRN